MKLLIALIIGLILFSGCVSFGNGADGVATDSIARMSYGGWLWKTWRVELTNDHPVCTSDGCNAQRYGIENNSLLIKELQDYSATGERVKLYYHGNLFVWDWSYSDAEIIYKVEPVNKR